MDKIALQRTDPSTAVQSVDEVPVEVHLPLGAEIECVIGHLWLTVRPPDKNFYVDDKFLVPGERFLASQPLTIWVSSFKRGPASFRVRCDQNVR